MAVSRAVRAPVHGGARDRFSDRQQRLELSNAAIFRILSDRSEGRMAEASKTEVKVPEAKVPDGRVNGSQPKNQQASLRTEVPGPQSRALRAREDAHAAPGLQGYAVMAGI